MEAQYRSPAKKGGSVFFLLIMLLTASTVLRNEAAAESIMSPNANTNSSNSGVISSNFASCSGEKDEECLLSIAEVYPELEFLADSEISRRLLLSYGKAADTGGRGAACRKDPKTGRYVGCTTDQNYRPTQNCDPYNRVNPCSKK